MHKRERLGRLEFEVLASLAQLAGTHGTGQQIRDQLASVLGRGYNLGAIYTTLTRLEAEGLVLVEPGLAEAAESRPRKTFALGVAGLIALGKEADRQTRLLVGLRSVLDQLSAASRNDETVAGAEAKRAITLMLRLLVENNNKFRRGKKRVVEQIEDFHLSRHGMKKMGGSEYELTFRYETEEELEGQIEDLLRDISWTAEAGYCVVEHDLTEKGGERSW